MDKFYVKFKHGYTGEDTINTFKIEKDARELYVALITEYYRSEAEFGRIKYIPIEQYKEYVR